MILRWAARLILIVGTFFLGALASGLIIAIGLGYNGGGDGRSYPTPQGWLDLTSTALGVALAVLVAVKTRGLTSTRSALHRRDRAVALATALGLVTFIFAGAAVGFVQGAVVGFVAGALCFWLLQKSNSPKDAPAIA